MERKSNKSEVRASIPSPPEASENDQTLTTYTVGALPLVNAILERIPLEKALRRYLPPDDPRLKVPTARVALLVVRNLLLSREPMYGVAEWAGSHEPKHVGLGRGDLSRLNDDRIGRCLDRVFDSDRSSLLLEVIAGVVKEFDLDLDELHNDSTTVTFFGEYRDWTVQQRLRGQQTCAITHGHNKDHRPDLKQLLFLLTTTADGAIPVHFAVRDGNTTDDCTHIGTWDLLRQLRGSPDFLYVADCKLATSENMRYIDERGGRFVTLLPRTRREDRDFRRDFDRTEAEWEDLVERELTKQRTDKVRTLKSEFSTAEGFRLWWIHSSQKDELDQQTRWNRLKKALIQLQDLQQRLRSPRTRFRDRERVEKALDSILVQSGVKQFLRVSIVELEEEEFRQAAPGRPSSHTQYRRVTRIAFDLDFEVDHVAVAKAARTDGLFPLVTNDREMTPLEVYQSYKRQPRLEKRFSQFKSDFYVAPVYLKNAGRVEALLCLYFFALLIEALLERELRNAMVQSNLESLPLYPEGRPAKRPCAKRLFEVFGNVQRHVLTEEHSMEHTTQGEPSSAQHMIFNTGLSDLQQAIVRLLGMPQNSFRE